MKHKICRCKISHWTATRSKLPEPPRCYCYMACSISGCSSAIWHMHTCPVSVQVDVLVNNAGLALGKAPAQDNDVADISVMLDTNCKAVAVLTKSVAKGMIERNRVQFPF